jgi:chemotaxis protein MotA
MDITSVGGIVMAIACILLGQALEGGHIGSIMQPTAAIIVFGGTLGAVALQFPQADLLAAMRSIREIFFAKKRNLEAMVQRLVQLANRARREGLISLENDARQSEDPFLRKALGLAVDGVDANALRATMDIELSHLEAEGEKPPKVFEAAGGYAPTVGILGAVLGLIHVMENLSDPSKLGSGIAVAFVATVYGVGVANLIFLPMAGKLKMRAQEAMVEHELVLEGVVSIASGENPQLIEEKLRGFLAHGKKPAAEAAAPVGAPATEKG